MRLFGKVDGAIDRYDRAGWLTMPFDKAFISIAQTPSRRIYIPSAEDRVYIVPASEEAQ